jgi:hypothetical protein
MREYNNPILYCHKDTAAKCYFIRVTTEVKNFAECLITDFTDSSENNLSIPELQGGAFDI